MSKIGFVSPESRLLEVRRLNNISVSCNGMSFAGISKLSIKDVGGMKKYQVFRR